MANSHFKEVARSWDGILERLKILQDLLDYDDPENISSVISGMEFQLDIASELSLTDLSELEQWDTYIRNLKMKLARMEA